MRQKQYYNRLEQVRDSLNVRRYNKDLPPITQSMLAKVCGVSRQTIIAIEQREQMPSYPLAIRICAVLRKEILKAGGADIKLLDLFPLPPLTKAIDTRTKTGVPAASAVNP